MWRKAPATRVIPPPNSTPGWLPSYLLFILLLYFIFYLLWITQPSWPNYDTPLPLTNFKGKINGIHDTPLHKNVKLNTTPSPTGNYDAPLLWQMFIFLNKIHSEVFLSNLQNSKEHLNLIIIYRVPNANREWNRISLYSFSSNMPTKKF